MQCAAGWHVPAHGLKLEGQVLLPKPCLTAIIAVWVLPTSSGVVTTELYVVGVAAKPRTLSPKTLNLGSQSEN